MTVMKLINPVSTGRAKKLSVEKNVWKFALQEAEDNIQGSIEDFKKIQIDPNYFPDSAKGRKYAAPCWMARAKHPGHYQVHIKVSTTKILLKNYDKGFDKYQHETSDYHTVVKEADVINQLQVFKDTLATLKKDDGEIGEALYMVGKSLKKAKGIDVGKTKEKDGKTLTYGFQSNDEWGWV